MAFRPGPAVRGQKRVRKAESPQTSRMETDHLKILRIPFDGYQKDTSKPAEQCETETMVVYLRKGVL
jgi:hypothetical protein